MPLAQGTRTLNPIRILALGVLWAAASGGTVPVRAADADPLPIAKVAASDRVMAAPAVQPDRIVPLLRSKLWLDRARWETAPDAVPQHERLHGNLFIVFAEDNGTMVRPLARREIEALGLAPDALRALAVANLRRMLPPPEVRRTGGADLVVTLTGYGASRILLDEFWRDPRFRIAGEPVFALATHDMIVLTDSASPEGVETAKTVAGNLFKTYPFAISGALYVRRDGAIAAYPR